MGYFSNGTEGDMYEEKYCNHCINMDQEKGCPVLNLHLLWNYEQFGKDKESKTKKFALDWFILKQKDGPFSDICSMFKKQYK